MLSLTAFSASAQEIRVMRFEQLQAVLNADPEKSKLVNFWATWCRPCVEELPYFIAASDDEKFKNVEFIFVSVDFLSQSEKVIAMIEKLGLKGTLLQLNEPGGEWIDALDSNWSGAIPYTLLLQPDGAIIRHYDAFNNTEELKAFINKHIVN